MKEFLEAGKIVNTHGIKGEVKIQPWTNEPRFLLDFGRFRINDREVKVRRARVQKDCVIASLSDIDDIEAAEALRGSIVYIYREDAKLDGEYFVQDIVGLTAVDSVSGETLGTVTEVFRLPANDVYVIGNSEMLVPAVPEFIAGVDMAGGKVMVIVHEEA